MPTFRSQSIYKLVYPFPSSTASTSIAASGGSGYSQVRRTFPDKYFVGTSIMGAVYNYAAPGSGPTSAIAGTPLSDVSDPSPPATVGNTWYSSTLVLVQFQINNAFDSDTAYPWSTAIGTGRQPHILDIPIVVPPATDTSWFLQNNSAIAIAGSIVIEGVLVDKGEYERYLAKVGN